MLDQSRLEATKAPANPKRPRRKPLGPTFWKLFTAFLFFGPALAVILFGYLICGAVASEERPKTSPIQAPAEEAAPSPPNQAEPPTGPPAGRVQPDGDVIYQDKNGTWINTNRGAAPGPHIVTTQAAAPAVPAAPAPEAGPGQAPNNLLSLGLRLLTGGSAGQDWSGPVTVQAAKADQFFQDDNGVWRNTGTGESAPVRSEHIYQDESGVWRNLSQSTGPDSASPAPVQANPMASLMSGLVSQGGDASGNPMDMLGGLLGGVGNGGGQGGGDLNGLVGALMAGGGQGGGGDLSGLMGSLMGGGQGGGGDLGGLMGALMGGGQGGGDLSGLMNGLMSSMAPAESSGSKASGGGGAIAPLNITRVRPQPVNTQPAASQASKITSNSTGLSLDGYERFDPAKAGEIKSDWQFFDDPR